MVIIKNHPIHQKLKLHERTRIDQYLENKSCYSTHINLKKSLDPTFTPKTVR